jgi:hypothetical protein
MSMAVIGLSGLGLTACVVEEDSGGDTDTSSEPEWVEPPSAVNDGDGEGHLQVPSLSNSDLTAIVVGAPLDDVDGVADAGVVSVFGGLQGGALPTTPSEFSERFYEDGRSNACASAYGQHSFASDSTTADRFGHHLTFHSETIGTTLGSYRTSLSISSPYASENDGRVMLHRAAVRGCQTCPLFSHAPPFDWEKGHPFGGDEFETEFGASVAFGVFSHVDVDDVATWRSSAQEYLVVGAPAWQGGGAVHVFEREFDVGGEDYRSYEEPGNPMDGSVECNRQNASSPFIALRDNTLTGGFGIGEEFGRSLAVADFDCDGFDDLAVGAPGADLPAGLGDAVIEDAGAVYLFRGGPDGLGSSGTIVIHQGVFGTAGEPEEGDRFGEVLAVANVNGRSLDVSPPATKWSCWDLVVGTPNEDKGRGEVQVFFGDSMAPGAVGPIYRIGENGIPGTREEEDRFGAALVGYRFDSGGFDDLAIGAPGKEGGRVYVLPGSMNGPDTNGTLVLQQDVDDAAGDDFGEALSAYTTSGRGALVVGKPGESNGAGVVEVFLFSENSFTASLIGKITADGTFGQEVGARWGSKLLGPRAFPTTPWEVF